MSVKYEAVTWIELKADVYAVRLTEEEIRGSVEDNQGLSLEECYQAAMFRKMADILEKEVSPCTFSSRKRRGRVTGTGC